MKSPMVKRRIHVDQDARLYPMERLRTEGHSWVLTIPHNSLLKIGCIYKPFICNDGTVVFKPVK